MKCLADRGGVLEHFHDYPDIPVIVNAELAGQVGDMPSVYVDSELHHDAVGQMTEDSLRHGQDIADLNVPWISLGVSGAFNFHYMLKNDTDLGSMLVCTATDTGARVVVGSIGKYAGSAAGLLVFGPAGAIVMGLAGAVGGSMVGRRAIAAGRRILVCNEEKAVSCLCPEGGGRGGIRDATETRCMDQKSGKTSEVPLPAPAPIGKKSGMFSQTEWPVTSVTGRRSSLNWTSSPAMGPERARA